MKKLELQRPQNEPQSQSYQELKAEEEDEDDYVSESESSHQDPFLNFVNTYSSFLSDAHQSTLDLQQVYEKMNETILNCHPPRYTTHPHTQ